MISSTLLRIFDKFLDLDKYNLGRRAAYTEMMQICKDQIAEIDKKRGK